MIELPNCLLSFHNFDKVSAIIASWIRILCPDTGGHQKNFLVSLVSEWWIYKVPTSK